MLKKSKEKHEVVVEEVKTSGQESWAGLWSCADLASDLTEEMPKPDWYKCGDNADAGY